MTRNELMQLLTVGTETDRVRADLINAAEEIGQLTKADCDSLRKELRLEWLDY